jgi:hypothetical protein
MDEILVAHGIAHGLSDCVADADWVRDPLVTVMDSVPVMLLDAVAEAESVTLRCFVWDRPRDIVTFKDLVPLRRTEAVMEVLLVLLRTVLDGPGVTVRLLLIEWDAERVRIGATLRLGDREWVLLVVDELLGGGSLLAVQDALDVVEGSVVLVGEADTDGEGLLEYDVERESTGDAEGDSVALGGKVGVVELDGERLVLVVSEKDWEALMLPERDVFAEGDTDNVGVVLLESEMERLNERVVEAVAVELRDVLTVLVVVASRLWVSVRENLDLEIALDFEDVNASTGGAHGSALLFDVGCW